MDPIQVQLSFDVNSAGVQIVAALTALLQGIIALVCILGIWFIAWVVCRWLEYRRVVVARPRQDTPAAVLLV
jgi:hypothetical protein